MNAKDYVDQVMRRVDADDTVKRRLTEDLLRHIHETGGDNAIERMGDPGEMAAELMDAIYHDKDEVVRELLRTRAAYRRHHWHEGYEYVSKTKVFGIPLVHIRFRRSKPFRPAVGIIAFGPVAVGAISFGALAFGGLCFGALALGLLAWGGAGIGLLLGVGGIAVGGYAVGGLAVGHFALGGFAAGTYAFGGYADASRVAVGGIANGTVAIGGTATGMYIIETGGTSLNASAVSKWEAMTLIERVYPDISRFILRLLTMPFR